MRKYLGHILLLTVLVTVPACEKQGGASDVVLEQVPAQLAMSLGGGVATRGDVTVIKELQDTPAFSGVEDIKFLAFSTTTDVSKDGATPLNMALPKMYLEASDLLYPSLAHCFGGSWVFTIPRETASFLSYGRTKVIKESETDPVSFKHKNGSLVETGFDTDGFNTSSIRFSPEVMLSSGSTPAAATSIAQALDAIVFGQSFSINAYYGTNGQFETLSFPWDGNIGDDNLRDCYQNITAGGALMPGSGTNVAAMLTNLYRAVSGYNILNPAQYEIEKDGAIYPATKENGTPLTYADIYKGVQSVILDRFNALATGTSTVIAISGGDSPVVSFTDEELATYPERLGLPSGAAVVRWTPSGYKVPIENGLDGIAPISAYCYPPVLYYFGDSNIRTSNDVNVEDLYVSGSDWPSILNGYKDGAVVTSSTRAVALVEPLHFAAGMLKASIKAESSSLQDNDDKDYTLVDVSGNKFPLTGVIIGRQYPQKYNFTPDYTTESKQYYMYDDQISGIYLTTDQSDYFRSLTLQTPEGKDTYFCLEFRNDSGQSFYGAEGRILPGHKFYLVGKLETPPATSGFKEVFTRNYITTVRCVIKSLADAHSAVPDMGIPQLNLGVETVVDWTMSDPLTLILE